MSQYVGKLISLVDTNNVRYGGVLASISAETSSLVLKDVIVYGTESRETGAKAVAAEPSPRASIEFKGSEVSDLQVLESEPVPAAKPHEQTTNTSSNTEPATNDAASQPDKEDDDDFYTRTQKLAAASEQEREVKAATAYDKSSFFDNLNKTNNGRLAGGANINRETFGKDYVVGRGRGRGRGRGGRGRGRGRGRGGNEGHERNHERTHERSQEGQESSGRGHGRGEAEGESAQGRTPRNARGKPRGTRVTEFTPGGHFA